MGAQTAKQLLKKRLLSSLISSLINKVHKCATFYQSVDTIMRHSTRQLKLNKVMGGEG
jgi:HKD family nuclease